MSALVGKVVSYRRRKLTNGGLSETEWLDDEEQWGNIVDSVGTTERHGRYLYVETLVTRTHWNKPKHVINVALPVEITAIAE